MPHVAARIVLGLALASALKAQGLQAASSGAARFVLPRGGLSAGPVLVTQRDRPRGRGELVSWAGAGRFLEFRGTVPKGRFRLVPAGSVARPSWPAAPGALEFLDLAVQWDVPQGRLVPRWRLQGRRTGLAIVGDLLRWPDGSLELRLLVGAEVDFEPGVATRLRLLARGRCLSLCPGAGATLSAGERGQVLTLPAGRLRPGDAVALVLRTGQDPADPATRVRPPARLPAALGFVSRARVSGVRGVRRRLRDEVDALVKEAPADPLDNGDFRRKVGAGEIWVHGEFDLALGLLLFGIRAGHRGARELARASAWHMLGRDVSRPWRAGGVRLPVRHGPVHGVGPVDPGHVFLEGCLLASLASADRLLFERTVRRLDELAALAVERLPDLERLRELAWPLRNLETGLRCLPRPTWRRAANAIVDAVARAQDPRTGFVLLPESRIGWGRRRIDTWIVCGLLLPGLASANDRGNETAREVLDRMAGAIAALPKADGRVATHYISLPRKGWRAADTGGPCAQAWVVEGLGVCERLRFLQRRMAREVVAALPGDTWDRATRLALCLRLGWLAGGMR